MTGNLALEWVGFARDLVTVSAIATVLVYLMKLARPSHESDRIAYLALAVATLATFAALLTGIFSTHTIVPWTVFALTPLIVFWLIESEFDTRLFGLAVGLLLVGSTLWQMDCTPMALTDRVFPLLAAVGALAAAGLLSLSASTILVYLLHQTTTLITARKSARFYSLTAASIREIAYRIVVWALPCLLFAFVAGALAFAERNLAPWPLVDLAASATLSVGYVIWCRRTGYETGYRPVLLLLMLGTGVGALRLLGIC